MQEQLQYKMTPEQGWSQMETILSKAMPVERRSRRLIIFWWSAAAVVMTAVVSTFLFIYNTGITDPSISINDAKESPVIEYQDKIIEPTVKETPQSSQNIASDVKEPSNATTPIETGNSSEKLRKMNSSNAVTKQSITSAVNKHVEDKSQVMIAADHNKTPAEQTTQTLIPDFEISLIEVERGTVNEQTLIPPSRETYITEFLPQVEISISEEQQYDIAIIQPATKIVRHQSPMIQPFVAAGSTLGIKNGIGVDAGAGLTTNLTPRLSLNTSLSYQTYKPDFELFGNTSEFDGNAQSEAILKYGPVLGNSSFYIAADDLDASISNEAIIPFIQSITQWQFSAGLSFDFTKRLSLESGVTLGFGTRAISQYPIVTFDYTGTVNGRGSIRNSFDGTIVRNNTTSIFMGVAYSLGKKFDLYAKYTHGLDQFLITDISTTSLPSGTEYIRGLNIGMRYHLCGS